MTALNNISVGDRKLRILVVPSAYPASDSDISGIFILDYLTSVKKYCDVTVLRATVREKGNRIESSVTYGFQTINYRNSSLSKLPGAKHLCYAGMIFRTVRLERKLATEQFDLIHVHGSTMHGMLAKRLAAKLKIPYVVTVHTGPFSKIADNALLFKISKSIIEKASMLFTVSTDLKNQIIDTGINPQQVVVTYNPVNTELFALGDSQSQVDEFLFVGRYEPYKGAFRALKAFHQISSQFPNWTFRLIGGGPEKMEIEQYVHENDLQDRVFVHNLMTKEQIASYLGKARVFVFPSEHETFGIVIAEAMSCGIPVVVGNRTAPPEFVKEFQGELVNPESIQEIGDSMFKVAKGLDQYSAIEIRKSVVNQFGFEQFGKQLAEYYLNVIDHNKCVE